MILRLVARHLTRQRRRVAAALLSVAAASAAVTAAATFAIGSEEKIVARLRALGPNIRVTPQAARVNLPGVGTLATAPALRDADVEELRAIGWRNNLLGVAPVLRGVVGIPGKQARVRLLGTDLPGLRATFPRWKLGAGRWPGEPAPEELNDEGVCEIVVTGESATALGIRVGDRLDLAAAGIGPADDPARVVGILSPGIEAEAEAGIVAPLSAAQAWLNRPGALDAVYVNALTSPEEVAPHDPRKLKGAERERWECTPYPSSIAWQIGLVLPHARAETIREMAAAEGATVRRISGALAFAAALAALLGTAGVALALAGAVLQRREEIALLRALGAGAGVLLGLLAGEGVALGLAGGALGWAAGVGLAEIAALGALGGTIPAVPALGPLVLALAVVVALAGVAAPARRVLAARPAEVLRGA